MPKSINDLYAESQMNLVNALEANLQACKALAGLIKGELKTEWFTLMEANGNIQWSYQKPEQVAPEVATQPN